MNKEDIIQELDTLKLKIMLDNDMPSDVKRYDEWVEKIQGRGRNYREWELFEPREWAEYSTMKALVGDLYGKKNYGYFYKKNETEIRKIIAEVVAMVMFIQQEK